MGLGQLPSLQMRENQFPLKGDVKTMPTIQTDPIRKQAQDNGGKIIEIAHKHGINELDLLKAIDEVKALPKIFTQASKITIIAKAAEDINAGDLLGVDIDPKTGKAIAKPYVSAKQTHD